MDVVHTKKALRTLLRSLPTRSIGLVPTMGNLHSGHLVLVDRCVRECVFTVATIFVNPLQFGPSEDFGSYPRTLDSDADQLRLHQVDVLFAPTTEEIYPEGRDSHTNITIPELSNILCGEARPGHFDGVATVVAKLFNLTQPNRAYFGEKDWQQLTLIKTMARQLDMPVDVVGVPTQRDDDGLALSSRNQYLTPSERTIAPLLHRTLRDIKHAIDSGARDYDSLERTGVLALSKAGFEPDYVAIRDAVTLKRAADDTRLLRVLGAASLGRARLIDNVGVDLT